MYINREEYIEDPTLFRLSWEDEFDVPEQMLDFAEKKAALADADGRVMSMIHRGDTQNYPENSIEGIISACMMGADIIEIDIRVTKDGYAVLFHDDDTHPADTNPTDDLVRTTNVLSVKGTVVNGVQLPDSTTFTDWTFEQLRCLNLKTGTGGNNAKVTNYVIPTLEEALTVVKGRCFVICDKITTESDFRNIVLPVMEEVDAYDNIIMLHSIGAASAASIQNDVKNLAQNSSGSIPYFYDTLGSDPVNWQSKLENYTYTAETTYFIFSGLSNKSSDFSQMLENNQVYFEQIKGIARYQVDCYKSSVDCQNAATWDRCAALGLNIIFVEKSLDIQKYIANKYFNYDHSLLY